MKRWSMKGGNVENEKVDNFLKEVVDVCRKHGFSISHEDSNGAFKVENYDDDHSIWLMDAHDNT